MAEIAPINDGETGDTVPAGAGEGWNNRSTGRAELLASLIDATRRAGSLMHLMSQAAADQIGINATDLNCLNILSFSGTMTAGQLAQATGLTTASTTGVIDRLEQAGYARRERDAHDRRRVVVRLIVDAVRRDVTPVFAPMLAAWHELAASYTDDELELIAGFQRRAEAAIRNQLDIVRRLAAGGDLNAVTGEDGADEQPRPFGGML